MDAPPVKLYVPPPTKTPSHTVVHPKVESEKLPADAIMDIHILPIIKNAFELSNWDVSSVKKYTTSS